MDKILSIVVLIFLIDFIGNIDGIRCYYCLQVCPDPFNKTNKYANPMTSPSGWCMKIKTSRKGELVFIRTSAPIGLCVKKKCKSTHHDGSKAIGCCCNTDLCNHSYTITIPLNIFIGLLILTGMNRILIY